jgi:hypothetical protein
MTLKAATAGRRKEIKEATIRKTYNLTVTQSDWICKEAERLKISDSKFLRDLLDQLKPAIAEEEASA